MKTMREQLTTYARYHRDRRNIATHFVGIPLIVVAVQILLSRVSVAGVSLAMVASLGSALYYIALDRRYGAAMTAILAGTLWLGAHVATMSLGPWLALGLGSFAVGWGFQFVGHFYEGKKPAFVDDLIGLLIGPLFLVAELSFALGQSPELHTEIVSAAGPTHA
jgi:uncharacterized membrane protein YGL010W